MKTLRFAILSLVIFGTNILRAQPLDVGDGRDGNLFVPSGTTNTLPLPDDGIFRFRTIVVSNGATLRFSTNASGLNPPVYLLATNYVLVMSNGTVHVDGEAGNGILGGRGGPGGFDGGFGAFVGNPVGITGDGKGPGGGRGGRNPSWNSSYGEPANFRYGNALCSPLVGGSGGGGGATAYSFRGTAGGGGGGALLIGARMGITNNGTIRSIGGESTVSVGGYLGGGGSGGAIRLIAPSVYGSASGTINVSGGYVPSAYGYAGLGGRIRVDSSNRLEVMASVNVTPATAASITFGSQLFVFPTNSGILEIARIAAGGITNNVTTNASASITLPQGPDITDALVRVVAIGSFYGTNVVPITVVVTPENGVAYTNNAVITLFGGRGSNDVTVTIPSGTASAIHAWTRQ